MLTCSFVSLLFLFSVPERNNTMSDATTSTQETTQEAPEKPKKTRIRKSYRLGVAVVLKEYNVPDGGLAAVPTDWDLGTHKELRGEDFSDVLNYFVWLQDYASKLAEAAKTKASELAAYGDADTRKEMTEILGSTESVAHSLAATMNKEGMTPEQKAKMAEQIKAILGNVLG
jgi:hypothetical protein